MVNVCLCWGHRNWISIWNQCTICTDGIYIPSVQIVHWFHVNSHVNNVKEAQRQVNELRLLICEIKQVEWPFTKYQFRLLSSRRFFPPRSGSYKLENSQEMVWQIALKESVSCFDEPKPKAKVDLSGSVRWKNGYWSIQAAKSYMY